MNSLRRHVSFSWGSEHCLCFLSFSSCLVIHAPSVEPGDSLRLATGRHPAEMQLSRFLQALQVFVRVSDERPCEACCCF